MWKPTVGEIWFTSSCRSRFTTVVLPALSRPLRPETTRSNRLG